VVGANLQLAKPFGLVELLTAIRGLLGEGERAT
jgi:DNA-binding response OmpR family regulator